MQRSLKIRLKPSTPIRFLKCSQLDAKDSLIQLANTINWTVFDDAFEQHYSQDNGRPSKPIRLISKMHQLGGVARHIRDVI
jgi:hypothetical protein